MTGAKRFRCLATGEIREFVDGTIQSDDSTHLTKGPKEIESRHYLFDVDGDPEDAIELKPDGKYRDWHEREWVPD